MNWNSAITGVVVTMFLLTMPAMADQEEQHGDPTAVQAQIEALLIEMDKPLEAHHKAARELAALGAPATPALLGLLEHWCMDVRHDALIALQKQDPDGEVTIPALRKAWANSREDIRFDAAYGLLCYDAATEETMDELLSALTTPSKEAERSLIQTSQRERAAKLLVTRGASLEAALRYSINSQQEERTWSEGLSLLKKSPPEQMLPVLLRLLTDPEHVTRLTAFWWLYSTFDSEGQHAIPALTEALDAADPGLRIDAATWLLRWNAQVDRAAGIAAALIEDEAVPMEMRAQAACAMAEKGLRVESAAAVLEAWYFEGQKAQLRPHRLPGERNEVDGRLWSLLTLAEKDDKLAKLLDEVWPQAIQHTKDEGNRRRVEVLLRHVGPAGLDPELVRTEVAPEQVYPTFNGRCIEYSLRFVPNQTPVFLARRIVDPNHEDDETRGEGFDKNSLKFQWLDPEHLLHVQWSTLNIGNGHWTMESNLLLLNHGSDWEVIYRDTQDGCYSGGASSGFIRTYTLAYEASSRVVTVFEKYSTRGDEGYFITRTEWRYSLTGNQLTYLDGSCSVDLEKQERTLEEVVKFVSGHLGLEDAATATAKLQELNPDIRVDAPWTGTVRVSNGMPPHEPWEGHAYRYGDST
jgi:hypothetical protein